MISEIPTLSSLSIEEYTNKKDLYSDVPPVLTSSFPPVPPALFVPPPVSKLSCISAQKAALLRYTGRASADPIATAVVAKATAVAEGGTAVAEGGTGRRPTLAEAASSSSFSSAPSHLGRSSGSPRAARLLPRGSYVLSISPRAVPHNTSARACGFETHFASRGSTRRESTRGSRAVRSVRTWRSHPVSSAHVSSAGPLGRRWRSISRTGRMAVGR